ncbi:MAG: hypothetical protein KGS72_04230 [Cyanobacteria bacterium REEB67]|nr:hypothetical protein [Cyanobacteria bacterium REEB67]
MYCKNCSGKAFIMNIGHCSTCGSMTSSGSHKLCSTCSTQKNQCMHCAVSLSPANGNGSNAGSNKSSFIVAVDSDHYLSGPAPKDLDAIKAHLHHAFVSFKGDLSVWTTAQNISDLTVANEMPNLCCLVIECSPATAEALKAVPGVAMVAENDTVHAI